MDRTRIEEYHATRILPDKAFRSACYAPHVSMYFDTLGNVLACCQNTKFPVGNVAEARLSEIWHGERARKLRRALQKDAFGAGCQFCEWQISVGNYANAFTRNFDSFAVDEENPNWPQMMEFSISNTCNLECIMCYGILSSSIRARREGLPPLPKVYGETFFDDLRPFLPHLKFVKFLGGEPFLAAESFRIWDLMHEEGATPLCNVTTNGTQWNGRVEQVLERFPVSICVSMDGATAKTVESIRVNARFETVMKNFRRFLAYTRQRGTDLTLTYCLMRQNWHEFGDYLRFADEHDCGVCVNLVREPPDCSLYTLPNAELAKIAESLERQSESLLDQLTRNRSVWQEQVKGIRRRVDHVEESTRTPFETPLALVVIDRAAAEDDQNRMTTESAKALLRDRMGADTPDVVFRSDQDDRVQSIEVGEHGMFGLAESAWRGESFARVVRNLSEQFGVVRTQQILRTAEYVDRVLQFSQETGELLAIRFLSVPQRNEYGMPAGSVTVAASRTLSASCLELSLEEAGRRLRDWDPSACVFKLLLDRAGRLESVPSDAEMCFGLFEHLAAGMNEAEIASAQKKAWGRAERVHEDASIEGEDVVHRFHQQAGILVTRSITLPRFDAASRHIGYLVITACSVLDRARIEKAEEVARATLRDWSGDGGIVRLLVNRGGLVAGVQSPLGGLLGLDFAAAEGQTESQLGERYLETFGEFVVPRWVLRPESLDRIIEHHTDRGHYVFRTIDLPHMNRSGHCVGVVRLIAAGLSGPEETQTAEILAEEELTKWSEGDPGIEIGLGRDGKVDSFRGTVDPVLGLSESQVQGKSFADMRALLEQVHGTASHRSWVEKSNWLDTDTQYVRPGRWTAVRCIAYPRIESGGRSTGWTARYAARAVDPTVFDQQDALARQELSGWNGGRAVVRVVEEINGVVRSVDGCDGEWLGVPVSEIVGRSIADLRGRWDTAYGIGRYSQWIEDATVREQTVDRAKHGAVLVVRERAIPYVPDDSTQPGILRYLASYHWDAAAIAAVGEEAQTHLRAWKREGTIIRCIENRHGDLLDIDPVGAKIDAIALEPFLGRGFAAILEALERSIGPVQSTVQSCVFDGTDTLLEFCPPGIVVEVRSIVVSLKGAGTELARVRHVGVRSTEQESTGDEEVEYARRLDEWDATSQRLSLIVGSDGMIRVAESRGVEFLGIDVASLQSQPVAQFEELLQKRISPVQERHRYSRHGRLDVWLERRSDQEILAVRELSRPVDSAAERGIVLRNFAVRVLNGTTISEILADGWRWLSEWASSDDVLLLREDRNGVPIEVEAPAGEWMGLSPEALLGQDPIELADQMQRLWGRIEPVSETSRSVFTDVVIAFSADRSRLLLRALIIPDVQDPGNIGGSMRLVAGKWA